MPERTTPSWQFVSGAARRALLNVIAFSDTDIFPAPLEAGFLAADPEKVMSAIRMLHEEFDQYILEHPPTPIRALSPVSQVGYRLASQIDPLWNIYYLTLVICAGGHIEGARSPRGVGSVFSYRFLENAEGNRVFDPSIAWTAFTQKTEEKCQDAGFVIICDIADFYHRISWSRLSEALTKIGPPAWIVARLGQILDKMDIGCFGLPVGGPASRLLAEMMLVDFDNALDDREIPYCRYVDDIRVFSETEEQAYETLGVVSDVLWKSGLSLQKAKTRVVQTEILLEEIGRPHLAGVIPTKSDQKARSDAQILVSLAQADPYSELRVQRDLELEAFAKGPDAVAIIEREFLKPRPNVHLAKRLVSSIAHLPWKDLNSACSFLLSRVAPHHLAPFLARLMSTIADRLDEMPDDIRSNIYRLLQETLIEDRIRTNAPLNSASFLRLISRFPDANNPILDEKLHAWFAAADHPLVTCELLLLWVRWRRDKELARAFSERSTPWTPADRRALFCIYVHDPAMRTSLLNAGYSPDDLHHGGASLPDAPYLSLPVSWPI